VLQFFPLGAAFVPRTVQLLPYGKNREPYGDTKQDAIQRAQSAAREIVLDRIARGELPPDSANAIFDIAA
jgi:hypothetical protein